MQRKIGSHSHGKPDFLGEDMEPHCEVHLQRVGCVGDNRDRPSHERSPVFSGALEVTQGFGVTETVYVCGGLAQEKMSIALLPIIWSTDDQTPLKRKFIV